MAMIRDLQVKYLCWIALILLLIATPVKTQDPVISDSVKTVYATQSPSVSCSDIHGQAFGEQTVKPGVCYLISSDEAGAFRDARTFCQGMNDSLGWDVTDIEDANENGIVLQRMKLMMSEGLIPTTSIFWIGQNDMKTENDWRYVNDSSNKCNSTVYLNWASDQPNGGRRQNCAALFFSDGGTFQDRRCDDAYNYLCKVKITSETVPSCPGYIEDTSTTTDDKCLDLWPVAFSNPLLPGVCYASASDQQFSFAEALSFCGSLPNGFWSVVDIEDADENLFFEAWNRDNFPKNDGYWVGQNDREQEGDYRYTSSGQCPVYLNWYARQPNGAREQNCMVMFKQEDGYFQDKDCSERHYTLCKLKIEPGPTQDPVKNCDGNTVSPEVTACSQIHTDVFGSVDNPGICYFVSGRQLTWELANVLCARVDGFSLVDIEDAVENEMLVARHRDFKPLDTNYWVGQNDRASDGTWQYLSVDTPSGGGVYLNWAPDQPNGGADQNCIMMDSSGLWQDRDCSESHFVTCKRRMGGTTAAATTIVTQGTTEGATTQPVIGSTTAAETVVPQGTTEGATTQPERGISTTAAETTQGTTEGATTQPEIGSTKAAETTWVTTEGATTQPEIGSTTVAETTQGTTEGATTQQPELIGCVVDKSRNFVFLKSDASCRLEDTLVPSYNAKSRIQCAGKCLSRGDCRGFGYSASGKEDNNCVLCGKIQRGNDLEFQAGSRYYQEA